MDTGESYTMAHLTRLLGVTHMTITDWRRGSQVRRPLPTVTLPHKASRRVFFTGPELRGWLREYRPDLLDRLNKEVGYGSEGAAGASEPEGAARVVRRARLSAQPAG